MRVQPSQALSYTFDAAFDEVFNNLSSNKAPSINLYEKSFWLTKAQEELLKGYYKGTIGEGFEVTEEMRRYLNTLVKTASFTPVKATQSDNALTNNSYISNLPEKLWFITYEGAIINGDGECNDKKNVAVVPITQDELWKVINNPFRGPTNRRVLRLDCGTDGTTGKVELIANNNIQKYTVRYLEKVSPIILTDLDKLNPNLYIDGEQKETVCTLDSSLHRTIIEAAAKMALLSWSPGTATS